LKYAIVAYFNLAKLAAKLLAARKISDLHRNFVVASVRRSSLLNSSTGLCLSYRIAGSVGRSAEMDMASLTRSTPPSPDPLLTRSA